MCHRMRSCTGGHLLALHHCLQIHPCARVCFVSRFGGRLFVACITKDCLWHALSITRMRGWILHLRDTQLYLLLCCFVCFVGAGCAQRRSHATAIDASCGVRRGYYTGHLLRQRLGSAARAAQHTAEPGCDLQHQQRDPLFLGKDGECGVGGSCCWVGGWLLCSDKLSFTMRIWVCWMAVHKCQHHLGCV